MDKSLVILGRQPALGLAELESLYGAAYIRPVGVETALVQSTEVDFARLGGAMKYCEVLKTLDTTHWDNIERYLVKTMPDQLQQAPEGKVRLGLSVHGLDISVPRLTAAGLTLKKAIRKTGRSVRVVPNNGLTLNSAQVIHNHLTGPNGWELILVRDGEKTIVARNISEQNITSYTLRDRYRPKRDPRVGMLPPKLAQILVNLASGQAKSQDKTILDPFCGTGVVLQEALLMGYKVYGTDIETRMVDYSKSNLEWLASNFKGLPAGIQLEKGDATNHQWSQPIDLVACETYLGRPFTSVPGSEILAQTVSECNAIIKKFLQNIRGQLQPGTRLCLAVPAWKKQNGFVHLPLLDSLEELGYNRMSFEHAADEDLIYFRENQVVARQLLVIIRK